MARSTPSLSSASSSELSLFIEMLMAERGAASHTVSAYARDLSDFLTFLATKKTAAAAASADHVRAYLEVLAADGLAPTSRARK